MLGLVCWGWCVGAVGLEGGGCGMRAVGQGRLACGSVVFAVELIRQMSSDLLLSCPVR